jgi:hypothetical protein
MIGQGSVFRCLQPPGHLFVVLTPPDENGEALVVNLSTLRDTEVDCACVLEPADYPDFIRHKTVVMYRCTVWGAVAALGTSRDFAPMPDLPAPTLAEILAGALRSDFLRERFKRIIRACMP